MISTLMGSLFGSNGDDETQPAVVPANAPAAVEPAQDEAPDAALTPDNNNANMLAAALLGLGTTGLGALLGGKDGGMLGAQQGLSAGASIFKDQADRESEAQKEAAAQEKRARQKEEDFEEFTRREDYKKEGRKEVKETVPGKAPETPKAPKSAAAPKPAKPPSAGQFAAAGYGRRIEQAEADFNSLLASGYKPTDMKNIAAKGFAPELMKSENVKLQAQAERNFLNAVLRKESGAAISPGEFSSGERQYFPREGDTPKVLEQKARNRAQKLAELKAEAGDAWEKVPLITSEISSGPKVGDVEGGYKFKGGDPADSNNWEKVKK